MRTYYMLSYDISDPKRWRRVFRIARDFGDHVQYSVFLCELSEKDKTVLTERLKDAISQDEDRILLVRLRGEQTIEEAITSLGQKFDVVDKGLMIY
jgi:CRISPR-associated protein Cas2